jgi:hypothetical protein
MYLKKIVYETLGIHSSNHGRRLPVNLEFDDKMHTIVNRCAPNSSNAKCDFLNV